MTDNAPTGRGKEIAAMLAAGYTGRQVAKELRVGESTVNRAKRRHAEWIDQQRTERVEATASALGTLAQRAVLALGDLLEHPNGAVRLGAARTVLDSGLRYRIAADTEARLAALEQTLEDQSPGWAA